MEDSSITFKWLCCIFTEFFKELAEILWSSHNGAEVDFLKCILICTYYSKTKEQNMISLNIKSVNRLVKRHKPISQIQIVYKNWKPWSLEDFNQDFH